ELVPQHGHVQTRHRDVGPDPVDEQRQEREEDLLLQLRDAEQVRDGVRHGAQVSSSSTAPPAASIFARAPALTACARTVIFRRIRPSPRIFTGRPLPRSTSRYCARTSGVIVSSSRRSRSRRLTISYTLRNGLLNPRFGRRRWSGIWPPSNQGAVFPPERALCPLCPRPLVFPSPDPGPRPTRLRARCAPSGRLNSLSFAIYASLPRISSTRTRCRTWKIIPRIAGLSSWTTVCLCFRRPSARSVARCLAGRPIPLRICVIFSRTGSAPVASFLDTAYPQLFHRDPTFGGHPLGRDQLPEPRHRRPHHVDRVVGAQVLGQHVGDPRGLEHRTNGASGNDARTGPRRLQQDAARAVPPQHLVRDRSVDDRHFDHAPPRLLQALADRLRDLVRLAERDAHVAIPVAHRDQRREREATA